MSNNVERVLSVIERVTAPYTAVKYGKSPVSQLVERPKSYDFDDSQSFTEYAGAIIDNDPDRASLARQTLIDLDAQRIDLATAAERLVPDDQDR